MPSEAEERIGYESGNSVNITDDLVNGRDYFFTTSNSINNNRLFMQENPVRTGSTYTNIIAYAKVPSYYVDAGTVSTSDYTQYTIFETTELVERGFRVMDGATAVDGISVYWYPVTGVMVVESLYGDMTLIENVPSTFTAYYRYSVETFNKSGYVQPAAGAKWEPGQLHTTQGISGHLWTNGYDNGTVRFILSDGNPSAGTAWNGRIYYNGNSTEYTEISIDATGKWYLNGHQLEADTGQHLLEISFVDHTISLSGLVYSSDYSSNPYPRIIDTYTYDIPDDSVIYAMDTIQTMEFTVSDYTMYNRMVVYTYSADVATGKQPYIKDQTVTPANYYNGVSVSYQIADIAFYGPSVALPGIGTQTVTNGKITFTGTDGEEYTEGLRNSVILAMYDADTGNYDVLLNGIKIAESISASDLKIIFNGTWYFTSSIYQVVPYTYEGYDWDFSQLNVSHNEYCIIGMLVSVLAFIGCAMYGKKSGGKVIWCLMISGLAFIIYWGMFE